MNIEIDSDVYDFIEKNAMPFIETTPNAVLRRLLLGRTTTSHKNNSTIINSNINPSNYTRSADKFVEAILQDEFKEDFKRIGRYRFMFESATYLIYFQNFNQESDKLWYRINQKPLKVLTENNKKVFICFTNPAEKIAYIIPMEDIKGNINKAKWSRDNLEVNIDRITSRWIELDWIIQDYLKDYKHIE